MTRTSRALRAPWTRPHAPSAIAVTAKATNSANTRRVPTGSGGFAAAEASRTTPGTRARTSKTCRWASASSTRIASRNPPSSTSSTPSRRSWRGVRSGSMWKGRRSRDMRDACSTRSWRASRQPGIRAAVPESKRPPGGGLSRVAAQRGLHGLAFLDGLHRQADAALLVDFQHLDLDHVAFLELVRDLLDALVGDLRDVHQAVLARQDGDERTEVHDLGDLAFVDATGLDVRGDLLDAGLGGLRGGSVHRGDDDGAVVLDVDLRAGFLGDRLDGRTALADHFADLVRMDLHGQQARRVVAQLLA